MSFATSWQLGQPHLWVRRGRQPDCPQKMREPLTNADAIPTRSINYKLTTKESSHCILTTKESLVLNTDAWYSVVILGA